MHSTYQPAWGTIVRINGRARRDGAKLFTLLPQELVLHPGLPMWKKAGDGRK